MRWVETADGPIPGANTLSTPNLLAVRERSGHPTRRALTTCLGNEDRRIRYLARELPC